MTTNPPSTQHKKPVAVFSKSRFYKWHRAIGLIALLPVIGWTLSGLSHPLMSNWLRPKIAREVYKPVLKQPIRPQMSLQQVLSKNGITQFRNFGLIHIGDAPFYQVLGHDSVYHYFSAVDGAFVPDGDRRYALLLARYFTQDEKSGISSMTLQTSFDSEYPAINRLLPVWKVSFNRPDGMDVYIETGHNRLATFNNHTRKTLLSFFEQCHTWQFLEAIGGPRLRMGLLLIAVTLMFISLLSGITVYGLFWNRFKTITQKQAGKPGYSRNFLQRFHRRLGLAVSLVMLTFTVSAAFHLLVKWHNLPVKAKSYSQLINTGWLAVSNLQLPLPDSAIKRMGIVQFNGHTYYQVLNTKKRTQYFDTQTGTELPNGDALFATALSRFYQPAKQAATQPDSTTLITHFTTEYGFINKRLPVWKVSYAPNNDWYIETSTAQLATHVAGIDRAEGFSFIFLHKYFGMTWAGKDIRDVVSMLAALGILVVALFGLASFIKN